MQFPTRYDVARQISDKYGISLDEALKVLDEYDAMVEREFLYGTNYDPMDASRPRGAMLVTGASVGKTVANFTHASGSVDFLGEHGGQRFAPVPFVHEGPQGFRRSKHAEARANRSKAKRKRKARR
jgi:hypothetical protein